MAVRTSVFAPDFNNCGYNPVFIQKTRPSWQKFIDNGVRLDLLCVVITGSGLTYYVLYLISKLS